MGAKYTKGQLAATTKYMQDKQIIKIFPKKEKAAEYKAAAAAVGKSMNQFIIDCVDQILESEVQ